MEEGPGQVLSLFSCQITHLSFESDLLRLRHASSHSERVPYRRKFIDAARMRLAAWILFVMYALRMYPGKTAKEIVETMILAMAGISRSELM